MGKGKSVSMFGSREKSDPSAQNNHIDFSLFLPQAPADQAFVMLSIHRCRPDPDQPRKDILPEEIIDLAGQIKSAGRVLQPITVRKDPEQNGDYLIKWGERRWRGCHYLVDQGDEEFELIPAIIDDSVGSLSPRLLFQHQMQENMTQKPLTLLDEARAIEHWMFDFDPPMTALDVVEAFGYKSSSKVSRLRKLLKAPPGVQELSKTLTNLNTLSSLTDLAELDPLLYSETLQQLNADALPDAEKHLRRLLSDLKKPATKAEAPVQSAQEIANNLEEAAAEFLLQQQQDGQLNDDPELSSPPSQDAAPVKQSKEKKPKRDQPKLPGILEGVIDSDLACTTDAKPVQHLTAAAKEGLAILQLTCRDGDVHQFELSYELLLKLQAATEYCLDS